LAGQNKDFFYVIRNRHWRAKQIDRLLAELKADRRFQYLGEHSFKVLKIFKFELQDKGVGTPKGLNRPPG